MKDDLIKKRHDVTCTTNENDTRNEEIAKL